MLQFIAVAVFSLNLQPEILRKDVEELADTIIKKRQFWSELQRKSDQINPNNIWSLGKKKAFEFEVRRLAQDARHNSGEFFSKTRRLGEFLDVDYRENQLRWKTAIDSKATMEELRELASESTSNADLEQFLDRLSSRLGQVPTPVTMTLQASKRSFGSYFFLALFSGLGLFSLTKLVQRENRNGRVHRS